MNLRELLDKRAAILDQMRAMVEAGETENRGFTEDEETEYTDLTAEAEGLKTRIDRIEGVQFLIEELPPAGEGERRGNGSNGDRFIPAAPAQNVQERHDTETNAMAAYLRSFGHDRGALGYVTNITPEMRASNVTDMNIGTAGDGGDLVPTGHAGRISGRRDESSLVEALGLLNVPGVGTTIEYPYDNEDNGEFVSTAESADQDLDSPAVAKASLTLAKYTKKVPITEELLSDTNFNLIQFVEDFVGRGLAKTENNLIVTEAGNGSAGVTFASATAIAFGEVDDLESNSDLGEYLDDTPSTAWLMRRNVHSEIKQLIGNARQYSGASGDGRRELLGIPVHYSAKNAETVASAKSVFLANWSYMAYRRDPQMSFLFDPYTDANKGWITLRYSVRLVFKILQAEAIQHGLHPTG